MNTERFVKLKHSAMTSCVNKTGVATTLTQSRPARKIQITNWPGAQQVIGKLRQQRKKRHWGKKEREQRGGAAREAEAAEGRIERMRHGRDGAHAQPPTTDLARAERNHPAEIKTGIPDRVTTRNEHIITTME